MDACLQRERWAVRTLLRSLKERQAAIDAAKGRIAALPDGPVKTTAEASLLMMPYGVDDYESVLKECIRIVSSSADHDRGRCRPAQGQAL